MKYVKIEKCSAGDVIIATSNILSNIHLMTEDNFKRCQNNKNFVSIYNKKVMRSTLYAPFDGDWYLVFIPVYPNQPLIANYDYKKVDGSKWNNVDGESVIVHNAPHTGGMDNFDKADYWEEQTGLKLPDSEFICLSCHEYAKRDEVDGAHVKLSHVTNSKMYIVPTCQTCNRSRQDRDFIVPAKWLVELP